jgi:hypothetical protein
MVFSVGSVPKDHKRAQKGVRRSTEVYRSERNQREQVAENCSLQPPAHAGSSFADFSIHKMEAIYIFLRNDGSHKIYTAPHPRRPHS